MTYSQIYKISDTKLIITLPAGFQNKEVLVTVADVANSNTDKKAMMKLAASDPLYLSDLKEVNDDFEAIEHETL